MEPVRCDYKECPAEATVKGHIYGHIRGSGESDTFLPVNVCDKHKMRMDFFEEGEIDGTSK